MKFSWKTTHVTLKEKYYLALQLSIFIHSDIILALHTFDGQYSPFRHCPDLQDTCQTAKNETYYRTDKDTVNIPPSLSLSTFFINKCDGSSCD